MRKKPFLWVTFSGFALKNYFIIDFPGDESSFTAYIIQVSVLVFLALSLQSIQLPLLLKFAIVSSIGVSLCFLFAYLIRRIPKADRVL